MYRQSAGIAPCRTGLAEKRSAQEILKTRRSGDPAKRNLDDSVASWEITGILNGSTDEAEDTDDPRAGRSGFVAEI